MRWYVVRFESEDARYSDDEIKTFSNETSALQFAADQMADPDGKVKSIISLNYNYGETPSVTGYQIEVKNGKFALVAIPEEGK
ncbi:hypothetical protein ON064_03985 [Planococcus sp. A6]|uniref:hypothetical protein n=1 Tax=Planococcus sp. A6 TaxID=2992760 RepID=UPI00237BC62D|nr:hypothetical protein [Planococcus sp. A6]MDE0582205.1 hypothetical protein [Planococcus sp. A6]